MPGEERSHSVCGDFFVKEFMMLHGNGSRKQRNDLVSFEFYKNPSGCFVEFDLEEARVENTS